MSVDFSSGEDPVIFYLPDPLLFLLDLDPDYLMIIRAMQSTKIKIKSGNCMPGISGSCPKKQI